MDKVNTAKNKSMSVKDFKKMERHIRSVAFKLVGEYYGDSIEQVIKSEKTKLKQTFIKILVKMVCEEFKVNHLKKINWFYYVDTLMYLDSLTIEDLK
jgi:hypothetical protein